jgi:hypothetical protein
MHRVVGAIGMLLLALAVTACSGSGGSAARGRDCFLVGAGRSEVAVSLKSFYERYPHTRLDVETCAMGKCERAHTPWNGFPTLGVTGFPVPDSRETRVRATVVAHDRTVFEGATTVRLLPGHINGPGCPPTTWFAQVSPHGASTLRQDHLTPHEWYLQRT